MSCSSQFVFDPIFHLYLKSNGEIYYISKYRKITTVSVDDIQQMFSNSTSYFFIFNTDTSA